MFMLSAQQDLKWASDPLELELQMIKRSLRAYSNTSPEGIHI